MKKTLSIVFVLLITVFYFYTILPVLSYGFAGITVLLLIIAAILFFAFSKFTISSDGKSYKPVTIFWKIPALLTGIAVLYAFVLPFFTSHPIFRNQDYRNLLGTVKEGAKITNQIAPISMNEIRVVDESLAYLLGEKILGS
ncbi:MAG: hypothetical protein RL494_1284 [Bacteroidota bacterium]|jgi:hypothetical protein